MREGQTDAVHGAALSFLMPSCLAERSISKDVP
jgi:hypothetical protein